LDEHIISVITVKTEGICGDASAHYYWWLTNTLSLMTHEHIFTHHNCHHSEDRGYFWRCKCKLLLMTHEHIMAHHNWCISLMHHEHIITHHHWCISLMHHEHIITLYHWCISLMHHEHIITHHHWCISLMHHEHIITDDSRTHHNTSSLMHLHKYKVWHDSCRCVRWRTATHCNTLQHTATHCNTLQHTDSCRCVRWRIAVYCMTHAYAWREIKTVWPCVRERCINESRLTNSSCTRILRRWCVMICSCINESRPTRCVRETWLIYTCFTNTA